MISSSVLAQPLDYPVTRKTEVVDDYFGTRVADPFRWLEDDNSAETKAWVQAQNKVTFAFLEGIPQRAKIRERLEKLWNYERFGIPFRRGDRWFFTRNSGLQNQSVLYVSDKPDGEPRELLDPNKLSADGTTSLTETAPSEDGKLLVYGTSGAGSDWQEFRVRDVATGEDKPDVLRWIKFSGATWARDGSGFYYSRYPEPKAGAALTQKNENQSIWFHKPGTNQDADKLVYARPDKPQWGFYPYVTEDGAYLVVTVTEGTDPRNRVFYRDLAQPRGGMAELLNKFDADYGFIENEGPVFYFKTNLDAPRYRIIAIDVTKPERENWREIVPQAEHKLDSVSFASGQLLCEYLQDAKSTVKAFDLQGKLVRDVELPGIGSISGFGGRKDDKELYFAFSSFTTPATIHRYDIASGASTVFRKPKLDFDGSNLETKQVFVTSKDGTRVPMFLVHRKGLALDGSNPTLLYGYGGFDISLTPGFSVSRAVWLELGGVFAMANLRGGGEYGSEWHQAGTKLRKQNVFDDFIACAEWLSKERYTQPAKLAIQGGSNGGLLVGACMTQRPELFGAAIPAVGVMDMLRFHKFTIGWAWKSDYGSSEQPDEFKAIFAYSPLHNLKPGTRYPATLVTTADHDDRVVPAHSFKFAARLQECQAKDGPPVLIRIETSAGHGAGTALKKVIEETADEWAFLVKVLGIQ
jgi:prolyl oligopeptidase